MTVATWPWVHGKTLKTVTVRIVQTGEKAGRVEKACQIAVASWAGIQSELTRSLGMPGVQFHILRHGGSGYVRRSNELVIDAFFGSGKGIAPPAMVNFSWEPYRNHALWHGKIYVGEDEDDARFKHVACHELGHALGLWHEQLSYVTPLEVCEKLAETGMYQAESLSEIPRKSATKDRRIQAATAYSPGMTDSLKALVPDTSEACVYWFDGERPVFDENSVMLYGRTHPAPSALDKRTVSALWGGETGFQLRRLSEDYQKDNPLYEAMLAKLKAGTRTYVFNQTTGKGRGGGGRNKLKSSG